MSRASATWQYSAYDAWARYVMTTVQFPHGLLPNVHVRPVRQCLAPEKCGSQGPTRFGRYSPCICAVSTSALSGHCSCQCTPTGSDGGPRLPSYDGLSFPCPFGQGASLLRVRERHFPVILGAGSSRRGTAATQLVLATLCGRDDRKHLYE